MLTVALLGGATLSPRPAVEMSRERRRPARPHLVALGDSVAAGFAAGGPPAAYPALVAARLGYTMENDATPGATAATVLRRQLPRVAAAPDVVTITVGANDIRFAQCFGALFGIGDDPCAGGTYRRTLDRLGRDLGAVLDRLRTRYPRAHVLVSRYYDPLPPRAADICGLDDARFSGGGSGD